jgi:hypothetical protein
VDRIWWKKLDQLRSGPEVKKEIAESDAPAVAAQGQLDRKPSLPAFELTIHL